MPAIEMTNRIVHESLLISTPLYRCGGFVADAVDDGAHFAHLIRNTAGYVVEKFVGELGKACGKAVDAPDPPERDHMTDSRVVTFGDGVFRACERCPRLPDR